MIRRAALAAGIVLAAAACGSRIFVPPAGPGVPVDAGGAWADATASCRDARSWAGELRVSGRAAGQRVWRLVMETAVTPSNIYMGASFSGQPIFLLTGTAAAATLWLRREHRVVRAPAGDLIDAILGVSIPPDRLLAVLTGCGTRAFGVISAANYSGVLGVRTSDIRVFLRRQDQTWRTYLAEADGFGVEFSWKTDASPVKLKIRSTPGREPAASLDVSASDVSVNETIPASLFNPPSGASSAEPMTLNELRTGAWRKQP